MDFGSPLTHFALHLAFFRKERSCDCKESWHHQHSGLSLKIPKMNDYGRYRDSGMYDGPSSEETDIKKSQSIPRLSGKSIYMQRKQYSQSVVRLHDTFQHRVEHLLTCDMDDKQMCNVDDAVARLKMLDSQGRVWGQELILQVKDGELLLTDIETREEMECFSLESVLGCCSVLNSCSYTSVLILTIKQLQTRKTSIYLFQCEELGADLLQINIEKAIKNKRGEEDQRTLRNNLENMLSHQAPAPLRGKSDPPPRNAWIDPEELPPNPPRAAQGPREKIPWNRAAYDLMPQQQSWQDPGPADPRSGRLSQEIDDLDRDTEILNHVLNDISNFRAKLGQLTGYGTTTSKTKKKKKKNVSLPPDYEYNDTFQKTKYAFNLLGKLNTSIEDPSAPDLVHILFSTLTFILSNCPRKEMASSVVSPLLTQKAINLLNSCVMGQERNTWHGLGDTWVVTRPDWPNGKDIPAYTPTFSDGWIPREPTRSEYKPSMTNTPMEVTSPAFNPREHAKRQPLLMRAAYGFTGRNSKELTIVKGDLLEVLDQSKQWWKVLNAGHESGYIPNNILEPVDGKTTRSSINQGPEAQRPVVLSPSSRPEEVFAWLKEEGFSKLTVSSLGALDGEQLLGMSRDELKIVCPEEGGRVFLQLASVKSSLRPGR